MSTKTKFDTLAFAQQVRAELSDLSSDEIEELTEGLEANLLEQLNEEGDRVIFSSAAAYAQELREAAGYSAKSTIRKPFAIRTLSAIENWFKKSELGSSIFEFALALRPVWWVGRVIIMYTIAYSVGLRLPIWLFPIFALASIQWGRKKWFTGSFFNRIVFPLNVLAILLLIPAQSAIVAAVADYNNLVSAPYVQVEVDGLRLDGERVSEINVFDETGQELTNVRIENQNGDQLVAEPSDYLEIPNLIGMSASDALQQLGAEGFESVDIIRLDEAQDEQLRVVDISPRPGQQILPNELVKVYLGN